MSIQDGFKLEPTFIIPPKGVKSKFIIPLPEFKIV